MPWKPALYVFITFFPAVNTDSDDWDSDEDNSDDISMQKATTQGNTLENEKGKSENCDEDR